MDWVWAATFHAKRVKRSKRVDLIIPGPVLNYGNQLDTQYHKFENKKTGLAIINAAYPAEYAKKINRPVIK
jgi:hypothetical protein